MPAFANRGATINRLRIRSLMDRVMARSRARWLLDESSLLPPTLSPSAILCIRRLADPRPGLIALGRAQRPPREWSDAVAAAVMALARGAERPWHGEASTNAEAVIFADRAEMLACLGADWCAGRLASWWWRALLKDVVDTQVVLRVWLEMPAYIAAAIDELESRGPVTTFVRRLTDADCRALLEAVVVQHGLTSLARALEPLDRPQRPHPPAPIGERSHAHVDTDVEVLRVSSPPPPWIRWVPDCDTHDLGVDQRCLLGVALMTRRAPVVVRTLRFAAEVQRWRNGTARVERPHDSPLVSTPRAAGDNQLRAGVPLATAPDSENEFRHTNERAIAPTPQPTYQCSVAAVRHDSSKATRGAEGRQSAPPSDEADSAAAPTAIGSQHAPTNLRDDHSATSRLVGWSAEGTLDRSTREPGIAHRLDTLAAATDANEPTRVPRALPFSIETQVGGLFYLLNVALGLGLYGDFTRPLQPGIDLPLWDFLTLVGRRLTPSRFHDDAVWTLLADLAGREADKVPGAAFNPPDAWRIPAEWLAAFPEGREWRCSESSERLRVVHPSGFVIVDVPRAADKGASAQVEHELSSYGVARGGTFNPEPFSSTPATALARWMRWLMPYLRARIGLALPEIDRRQVGALMCVQRARIFTSPTHLDVMFSLAELPIAIRLSGLDRDPGWVPSAGRVITFHYD